MRIALVKPADVALLAIAAAALGVLYAAFWQPPSAARWVEVRSGGTLVGRYALTHPRRLTVEGRQGPSIVAIESGRARFLDSPCRNRICIHSGWQDHAGDAAACLPNRVSLRLLGDDEGAVDALAY